VTDLAKVYSGLQQVNRRKEEGWMEGRKEGRKEGRNKGRCQGECGQPEF